jgi:hypothetical protein
MRSTLAVDYDGTLVADSWPTHGDWNAGALEALHALVPHFNVTVHSCRTAPVEVDGVTPRAPGAAEWERAEIRRRLDEHGLFVVTIHDDPWKPGVGPKGAYIDNRAIHYNGRPGAWKAITERLLLKVGKEID